MFRLGQHVYIWRDDRLEEARPRIAAHWFILWMMVGIFVTSGSPVVVPGLLVVLLCGFIELESFVFRLSLDYAAELPVDEWAIMLYDDPNVDDSEHLAQIEDWQERFDAPLGVERPSVLIQY